MTTSLKRKNTARQSPSSPVDPALLEHDALSTKSIPSPTAALSSSAFRNVSACNRCRVRKNKCDQNLPACESCKKAGVKCVGYDPITKREIPRSYVYYLESRIDYLQGLLREHNIAFRPPEDFALSFQPKSDSNGSSTNNTRRNHAQDSRSLNNTTTGTSQQAIRQNERYDSEKLNKLVSNIGMASLQGTSDPRYLGSTSGISFARVVFAAVKSSVSGASSERGSVRPSKPLSGTAVAGGTSMRDSFFGLHTKPTIKPAPFPDRDLGLKLVELYFEHANPQIPILHRPEFMEMFERVYKSDDRTRTPRESYMLNIVFAIGAAIILGGSSDAGDSAPSDNTGASEKAYDSPPSPKKRKLSNIQSEPEQYHASAVIHLDSFLNSTSATDRPDGFGAGLEELQAVLLLAGFALLRPIPPGLWYIIGVAVRLGVDLGLHYEDGIELENTVEDVTMSGGNPNIPDSKSSTIDAREKGRRQWVRDLRRRLWWCVYSFDRLVSTCVGRPFGITDQVVTTEFPSLLDDKYITKEGFLAPAGGSEKPSYKFVAHHYFRLRLLQSEILQVLQYRQAQQVRATGANQNNPYMHTKLPSPFLLNFDSFRSWRRDIDRRLWEWKESAPSQTDAGVAFSPLFLELNYWQAVIMLYRQSLTVPPVLADELGSTNEDVQSPSVVNIEEREDEETVFLKVAEAGQKVLRIYRQLHRVHLVNYTFLATHHLFMAGISFLYAIWHSTVVRSQLSLDDVDFTVLAATSVLGDLIEKCPPAEACRDAFDRMSKATIQMCLSTTGFGSQALSGLDLRRNPPNYTALQPPQPDPSGPPMDPRLFEDMPSHTYMPPAPKRPIPRFDMNLGDLFSDDERGTRAFNRAVNSNPNTQMRPPAPVVKRESNMQSYNTRPSLSPHQQPYRVPVSAGSSPLMPQQPQVSPYQISNQMPYSNFAQSIQSAYPDMPAFTDLDFLDSFPVNGFGQAGAGADPALTDLGIGLGGEWVGNHDWADGSGIDLFEGFFFGGAGNGTS